MRAQRKPAIVLVLALFCSAYAGQRKAAESNRAKPARDYLVKPVPFTAVHFNDVFWAPRIEINRTVTIPFAFQ